MTIFYPNVASVLGLVGAFAGLLIVYILPVITYLKKVKTECEHPLLAKAIEKNLYVMRTTGTDMQMSPKIVVNNAVLEGATPMTMRRANQQNKKPDMKRFYWECFTHSFIIIYGVLIVVFQFYNPIPTPTIHSNPTS